jgi:hypothetical protein
MSNKKQIHKTNKRLRRQISKLKRNKKNKIVKLGQRGRTVKAPAVYGYTRKTGVHRNNRIKHVEQVATLNKTSGGTSFWTFKDVNPGLDTFFPWLSIVAHGYESYIYNSFVIRFVPAVSTADAGTIFIIPDYDAADVNDTTSLSEMMSHEDSVSGPMWKILAMRSTSSNLKKSKQYYVRTKELKSDLDIKTYDTLQLEVCCVSAFTGTIGYIEVEYDITLFTPQINSIITDSLFGLTTNCGTTSTLPFVDTSKTSGLMGITSTIGADVTSETTIALWEPGRYLLQLYAKLPTPTSATPATPTVDLGGTLSNVGNILDWTGVGEGLWNYILEIPNGVNSTNALTLTWNGITFMGNLASVQLMLSDWAKGIPFAMYKTIGTGLKQTNLRAINNKKFKKDYAKDENKKTVVETKWQVLEGDQKGDLDDKIREWIEKQSKLSSKN